MKITSLVVLALLFVQCSPKQQSSSSNAEVKAAKSMTLTIDKTYSINDLSTRAIEWIPELNRLYFGASEGSWGYIDEKTGEVILKKFADQEAKQLEFRGIASNMPQQVYLMSAGSPAIIYRIDTESDEPTRVYHETGESVFYDALSFSDATSGVAFGDEQNGCMSVLLTTNGGLNWSKLNCDQLPAANKGSGAFAASNSNIALSGYQIWLAGKDKILHSSDYGLKWESQQTPIISNTETQGIYSIDFFNNQLGVGIGGDYKQPKLAQNNIIITQDGGNNWTILNGTNSPGYRSCIKFLPRSNGLGLITTGFEGVNGSVDQGKNWTKLSDDGYYTLIFTTPTKGYLAGKGKISKFSLAFDH